MTTVYFPSMATMRRRAKLYAGDLFVFRPRPSRSLIGLAREMIEEAFAPHSPVTRSTTCRSSISWRSSGR